MIRKLNIIFHKHRTYKLFVLLSLFPFIFFFLENYFLPFSSLLILKQETADNFINPNLFKNRKIIDLLENLSNSPTSLKRHSLLFIPQSNYYYWGMTNSCDFNALIAPSFTGIAMLDGIPSAKFCNFGPASTTKIMNERKNTQSLSDISPKVLCHKATIQGFVNVIVIDLDKKQNILVKKIECSKF